MNFPHSTCRRGSTLILVMCAVALLAFTVISLAQYMESIVAHETSAVKLFRARQLAESGVYVAYPFSVSNGDPILIQQWSPHESFQTTITGEGGRLPINQILQSGNQAILERLFTQWGCSTMEIQTAIDCLLDWIDSDSNKRPSGAEQPEYAALGYPTHPTNQPFHTVSEMGLVIGMDKVLQHKPDALDYFTVWSQGKVDLNYASSDVIQAVCNIQPSQADAFIRVRNGPDALPLTKDDLLFTNFNQSAGEIAGSLGISRAQLLSKSAVLTVGDTTMRITSVATVEDIKKSMTVIVTKTRAATNEVIWIER